MSITGSRGIGIPTVLLHEGEGYKVTVETKSNEIFRGLLSQSEDNMNVFMKNVTHINQHGKTTKLQQVYLRGNQIRFVILPDMLANAPMFSRVAQYKKTKGRVVPQGSGVARPRLGGRPPMGMPPMGMPPRGPMQ